MSIDQVYGIIFGTNENVILTLNSLSTSTAVSLYDDTQVVGTPVVPPTHRWSRQITGVSTSDKHALADVKSITASEEMIAVGCGTTSLQYVKIVYSSSSPYSVIST